MLAEDLCLNDSLVDFFLRLVTEVMTPESLRDDLHVTSSYFFSKLTSGGVASGEEGWHNVSRWTRSIEGGLGNQRYVVMPINENNIHWWLVVICHPLRAFMQTESHCELESLKEAPRIVCLDSGTGRGPDSPQESIPYQGKTASFLRGYLWREWCERHPANSQSAASSSPPEQLSETFKLQQPDVPKQANGYDCGVFIIEYLLHILRSGCALASLGLTAHHHWFNQAVVTYRRKRLKSIAEYLYKQAHSRGTSDVTELLKDVAIRVNIVHMLGDPRKRKASSAARRDSGGDERLMSDAEQRRVVAARQSR